MREEPALFLITPERSWPYEADEYDPGEVPVLYTQYGNFRSYGRRIVQPSYSESNFSSGDPATDAYSYLSFIETGETARIYGGRYLPGTVVLCQQVNHQWFVVTECFVATPLIIKVGTSSGLTDGASFPTSTLYQGTNTKANPGEYTPYTIELITTGDYKAELDGLYTLFSYFPRQQKLRQRKNYGCMGTNLKGKAGASMLMEFTSVVYDGEVQNYKTLTVTHDDITETVYEGYEDILTRTSGDTTLPADVHFKVNLEGNSPLWFELDTESELPINGLYTLWPEYWEDTTNASYATSKGYFHLADGTRQSATYSMGYASSVFTISVTITGDSFTYTCDLADFNFVNGERMTFTLGTDLSTDSGKLPATITVRRPRNGYNRAVKLEDQP
ncbi:hypothetical protein [Gimesia maris]|uniref:hypothetical protein n=1 Tax=Gimesia maris TaxID=122 RepID=UPI0032EBF5B0